MRKKILTGLIMTSLALSLVACGKEENTDTEVTISDAVDYSKLKFEAFSVEVTDDMVNSEIQALIDSGYKPVPTDHTVVDDCDIITVDII